ncbi:MAG TPA: aminopeptidase [Actinomycetota bacterium]|nr:aminopeptidase [Actinomycetota bacterium]
MRDPRIEQYARILVDTCVGVEEGWQVMVMAGPRARPLVDEIGRQLGARGAYALFRANLIGILPWMVEAPEELLDTLPPIEAHALDTADGLISIDAPENTSELTAVPPERLGRIQASLRPHIERVFTGDLKWVGCNYPTPALAQDAGMSLRDYENFLFGACLLDWDAERARMSRYAERFDAAGEVRIVGAETDLTLSLEGRSGVVDAGGANMPGGEFYFSPVEDSADGTISFLEFPAPYLGRNVTGIRLRFEGGKVVDASCATEEEFFFEVLDQDEGSRRLGELGIGCNPGITRFMKNTLFDEKIDGTVHLALGNGIPDAGGTNQSEIHWDIVKDLRPGGQILLDGEVVQQDGEWQI